jgi:uncharacterized protein YegP (UPF0339 family)
MEKTNRHDVQVEISYFLASGFRWMLRAGNGQLIAVSEKAYGHDYEAKAAVEKVLAQIRRSRVKGVFIYRQAGSRRLPVEKDEIEI